MELEQDPNPPAKIFLSRRNLLTLINKLDRVREGGSSMCTLIKTDNVHPLYAQTMPYCIIRALEDEDYYSGRAPGPVLPVDEPR